MVVVPLKLENGSRSKGYLGKLLMFKDAEGNVQTQVVKASGTKAFLEKNNYNVHGEGFSGIVRVEDWGGKLIDGEYYDNGKHKLRAALEAYIVKMEYLKLLAPDKGVVFLRRSTDSLFRERWYLVPTKYEFDKRQSHLPQQYYRIKDRIVLVWDDDNRQDLDSLQKQPVLACLDSLLKDKVLPFEYVKQKWETREEACGPPRSDPKSQEKILSQSFHWPEPVGSVIYVFNKDGTFQQYADI